jgi:hypothetical protein
LNHNKEPTYNSNNNIFLLVGGILLFFSEKLKWGSLGKNWCMTGVILNFLTLIIFNKKN